jgi:hypothetical protein
MRGEPAASFRSDLRDTARMIVEALWYGVGEKV